MILAGDCIEQMRTLDAESVDAVITDPPYGIGFMGKGWDNFGGAQGLTPEGRAEQQQKFTEKYGRSPLYTMSARPAKMAPSEAAAFQEFSRAWAAEAYRVLKPGGYLLAFGGTRTYHRLASGVEDAGFEIRDCLLWLYGSGFPKSLNVSKAIDKAACAEREVIGKSRDKGYTANGVTSGPAVGGVKGGFSYQSVHTITATATDAAREWEGWGTALKPAVEPIVMARKPLIGTVAENVQRYGTGAINIDATRVGTEQRFNQPGGVTPSLNGVYGLRVGNVEGNTVSGRWPANVLLDEEAAAMLDEQSGNSTSGVGVPSGSGGIWAPSTGKPAGPQHGDSGGASRFFYVAKASRSERNKGLELQDAQRSSANGGIGDYYPDGTPRPRTPDRNIHPTVKPVQLMRYLIRLVTPKGGTVLDPFLGSGTTAVAAIEEGVAWIGCEREPDYLDIIRARVAAAQPGMGLNLAEK